MKLLRYIIINVLLTLWVGVVGAETVAPTITSRLSADTVTIGDRVVLTVDVEKDVMHILRPLVHFRLQRGA